MLAILFHIAFINIGKLLLEFDKFNNYDFNGKNSDEYKNLIELSNLIWLLFLEEQSFIYT